MFYFSLAIQLPIKNFFKIIEVFNYQISKHKFIEIGLYRSPTIFGLSLNITVNKDHPGIHLSLSLLTYQISFDLYDNRHDIKLF